MHRAVKIIYHTTIAWSGFLAIKAKAKSLGDKAKAKALPLDFKAETKNFGRDAKVKVKVKK